MHLTNNAVQKNCKQYGQIHEGNQITIEELVSAIGNENFTTAGLFEEFERIIKVMVGSTRDQLLSGTADGTFQLLGLDFMIDSCFKVWLIEANCNPCLEESSAMLKKLLPSMLR